MAAHCAGSWPKNTRAPWASRSRRSVPSERDISAVKVGQKCRIRTDAWPDRVYDGVASRLMPIADRAKAAAARECVEKRQRETMGILRAALEG